MSKLQAACLLAVSLLFAACGGSGSGAAPASATGTPNTSNTPSGGDSGTPIPPSLLKTLLDGCIGSDLSAFQTLLTVYDNFLTNGTLPQPKFDLLAGLLNGGKVPYTLDLDGDSVADVSGNVYFTDADGKLTIPVDLTTLFGGTADIQQLLSTIPDGTVFHLTFDLGGSLLGTNSLMSGSGSIALGFSGGLPTTTSGDASLASAECSFDFTWTDLTLTGQDAFLPAGDVSVSGSSAGHTISGTLSLDGTTTATIRASADNQPEETYLVDLTTGKVSAP